LLFEVFHDEVFDAAEVGLLSKEAGHVPRGVGALDAHLDQERHGQPLQLVVGGGGRGCGGIGQRGEGSHALAQRGDDLVGTLGGDAGQAVDELAVALLDGLSDAVDRQHHRPGGALWPDLGRRLEQLPEALLLVAREAVEHGHGLVARGVVGDPQVERAAVAQLAERLLDDRRQHHLVADAVDVDDDPVVRPAAKDAAQRDDHAYRATSGCLSWLKPAMARAMASVTSARTRCGGRRQSWNTIPRTCSLDARPLPVRRCFTVLAVSERRATPCWWTARQSTPRMWAISSADLGCPGAV